MKQEMASFRALVETVERLRSPNGCPWDREQTHASLKRNLLEESYEVLEAIDTGDPAKLSDELGRHSGAGGLPFPDSERSWAIHRGGCGCEGGQ